MPQSDVSSSEELSASAQGHSSRVVVEEGSDGTPSEEDAALAQDSIDAQPTENSESLPEPSVDDRQPNVVDSMFLQVPDKRLPNKGSASRAWLSGDQGPKPVVERVTGVNSHEGGTKENNSLSSAGAFHVPNPISSQLEAPPLDWVDVKDTKKDDTNRTRDGLHGKYLDRALQNRALDRALAMSLQESKATEIDVDDLLVPTSTDTNPEEDIAPGAINVQHNTQTGSIVAISRMEAGGNVSSEGSISIAQSHDLSAGQPANEDGLPMAAQITDDRLPLAEQMNAHDPRPRQVRLRRDLMALGIALVLLVGLPILFVLVFVKKNDKQGAPDSLGATNVMTDIPDHILSLLPMHTREKINLNDERLFNTAQSKAYAWVLNDPNLQSYPDWRIVQRFAMVVLFHATNGIGWFVNKDWLSYDVNEIHWYSSLSRTVKIDVLGVRYDDILGSLLQGDSEELGYLFLGNNNLVGELPDELYLLSSLRMLELSQNDALGGTLSSLIGNLQQLEIFMLGGDDLVGSIPSEIGQIPGYYCMLWANKFTSTLPTEMGQMNAIYLHVESNQLTGSIPSQIGLMSNMLDMKLGDNYFTGQIPSQLGQMTAMQVLHLQYNELFGTIPQELVQTQPPLNTGYYLDLLKESYPDVAGLVPLDLLLGLVATQAQRVVLLQQNQLVGRIPENMGNLDFFAAHMNKLEGTIPTNFGNLRLLSLFDNLLSGPIIMGQDPAIEYLLLSQNFLTGTIPTALVDLSALNLLWVARNAISGTIPNFEKLFDWEVPELPKSLHREETEGYTLDGAEIDVSHNLLSGAMPTSVGTKLVRLSVASNQLTGTISGLLGGNNLLQELNAGHNLISGTLPTYIALWPSLQVFNVTSNKLIGTVPTELTQMTDVKFDFSNNSLDGL